MQHLIVRPVPEMDNDEVPTEPLFRANKRRKIFRKRTDADAEEETLPRETQGADDAAITEQIIEHEQPLRFQRRGGIRKQGIAFSSAEGRRSAALEEERQNEERALVPIANEEDAAAQNDRFVKPTGKVGAAAEDKHMYVRRRWELWS